MSTQDMEIHPGTPMESILTTKIYIDKEILHQIDKNDSSEKNRFLPEKCFKSVIGRLDLIDRLILECVDRSWKESITYDDIKSFRLSDLSSWSSENALTRWNYRSAPNIDFFKSIDKEWSTFDENTLNRILTSVLSRCKNLISLSFSPVEENSESDVRFVITSDTVRLLKSLAPHIQKLDLSRCLITDEALVKLFKKTKRNLMELNLNECILAPTGHMSSCHLEKSLDDALCRMRRLRRLNPSIHNFDSLRLPETGLQCFTSLELTNRSPSADDQLTRLWSESDRPSVYKLDTLVLSDNNSIERFDIVSHLQFLRNLTLQRLPRLSDEDLQQIFHWCQKLVRVDLVDCRRIRFRFRWPGSLRRVRIIDPCGFDSQNLLCLGAQCLKLKKFELRMKNMHFNGPDANSYLAFAKICTKLMKISIDVITVPQSILFYFAIYCKKLTSFSCRQVASNNFLAGKSDFTDTANERRSSELRSISLWNMSIDFHHFMELIDHCRELKNLNLRRVSFDCKSTGDPFTSFLSMLATRCSGLQNVSISDCPDVSQKSIRSFQNARKRHLESGRLKRLKFYYRNSVQKLIENDEKFEIDLKILGINFDQDVGIDYSQHKETCFGSSLDTPAFC